MNEWTPSDRDAAGVSLDVFLRDILPEVKIALGAQIDRENARAIPGRYARLLPKTLLIVTLRGDAATALEPLARQIETELTDSCNRHGSLYDRSYAVQLRRSNAPDSPLFTVSAHAGQAPESISEAPPEPMDPAGAEARPQTAATVPLPSADPDATRAEGWQSPIWQPGRWMLVLEGDDGVEREAFRLVDPFTTIGRRSDDPLLRVTVGLSDVPQVSRRQLALLWDGDEPMPGFQLYNLGLNSVYVEGHEVTGARVGRGSLHLEELDPVHGTRVGVGVPIQIGEHGPRLRIVEVPDAPDDPDATIHD